MIRGSKYWIVGRFSSTSRVSLKIAHKQSVAASNDRSLSKALNITFNRGEFTTSPTGTSRSHDVITSRSWGFVAAEAGVELVYQVLVNIEQ